MLIVVEIGGLLGKYLCLSWMGLACKHIVSSGPQEFYLILCMQSPQKFLSLKSDNGNRGLIDEDIGPSTNLNWVATIWTIGSAIGFLLFGRLSDIFGRKWMVMGTSVLSLLGCIVGGTANNIDTLVGANLMNGIAAAGQLSFGIVLGELVPNKHRGPVVSIIFLSSLPFAGKVASGKFPR
jgi:MFS family permease